MSGAGNTPSGPVEAATELAVLGSGPGGYTAAFRAADLGLEVTLIERHAVLGGVCLNVGCIPSKALLHIARVAADVERARAHGLDFGAPTLDLDRLREWKESVVEQLTSGLAALARRRNVRIVTGTGRLLDAHTLDVDGRPISFEHLILATGSRPRRLDGLPDGDARIMGSTAALALEDVPPRLLVIGGGIVGLELAGVYDALGSRITVVELGGQLLPECDSDLVAPLHARLAERYEAIHLRTRIAGIATRRDGLRARLEPSDGSGEVSEIGPFDRALVAIGRVPNSDGIGLAEIGVELVGSGCVAVDSRLRTSVPHIHAIGDLAGPPMLAHKATHEGRIAAEVVAGEDVELDIRGGIPSVAYTDPEVAWVGLTEREAASEAIPFRRVAVPWRASGRALASDAAGGLTKLLLEPESERLLGAGVVGANAGELIAQAGLALELESSAGDLSLTVHPHPTLAETLALAAQLAEGTATDLPPQRRAHAS